MARRLGRNHRFSRKTSTIRVISSWMEYDIAFLANKKTRIADPGSAEPYRIAKLEPVPDIPESWKPESRDSEIQWKRTSSSGQPQSQRACEQVSQRASEPASQGTSEPVSQWTSDLLFRDKRKISGFQSPRTKIWWRVSYRNHLVFSDIE